MICQRCHGPKRHSFLWWKNALECSDPDCLGLYSDAREGVASALFLDDPNLVQMRWMAMLSGWLATLYGSLWVACLTTAVGLVVVGTLPDGYGDGTVDAVAAYLIGLAWMVVVAAAGGAAGVMVCFCGAGFKGVMAVVAGTVAAMAGILKSLI